MTDELDAAAMVQLIAYKTSAGPVIQRYITNNLNNTSNQLKGELTMIFAEISDSNQPLKMDREIRQHRDEKVKCYAESVLYFATEAYSNQHGGVCATDRAMVGHSTDSLYFDYMQFLMLREKRQTQQDDINLAKVLK